MEKILKEALRRFRELNAPCFKEHAELQARLIRVSREDDECPWEVTDHVACRFVENGVACGNLP